MVALPNVPSLRNRLAWIVAAEIISTRWTPAAAAGPFGLALSPPMGFRSWNSMGKDVTQAKMQGAMDKLVEKRRYGGGDPISLADLGYATAGLDDAWQACGTGINGSFHAADGTPLVNSTTFPNMGAMVEYGHKLGLGVGFYINNCICAENMWRGDQATEMVMFKGTVKAIAAWNFDGVKIVRTLSCGVTCISVCMFVSAFVSVCGVCRLSSLIGSSV